MTTVFENRFLFLLVAMLLLMLIYPLLANEVVGRALINVLFAGILLSAIYSVSNNTRSFKRVLLTGIPTLIAQWLALWQGSATALIGARILMILFLGLAAITILGHSLKEERVEASKIHAALCVYLLIGLIWALAFQVVESAWPGSLQFGCAPLASLDQDWMQLCLYFSYVTLTTLGYGDVTAVSPLARSLAVLEATVGQLFLAVLVARLVGLHIVYSKE